MYILDVDDDHAQSRHEIQIKTALKLRAVFIFQKNYIGISSKYFSTSIAAIHPIPAAVTA